MDNARQQVADRLKQATNVLVTVRRNPPVDLLCACIGLTLALDKLDKHATAVFSGEIPNAISFLKPQETLERNADSLRDFIIALDKSKADKLRYKVEDNVVRIFITPYRTSLSQNDLEFSQGDFNVDVIVALGAHEQEDLDEAITVHGRILHDATIVSINNTVDGNLGSINWQDTGASSLSEMVSELLKGFDNKEVLDGQIATALLTGIVAETGRFSNEKTSPKTMGLSGDLMAAGADQRLVANELQAAGSLASQPVPALSSKDTDVKAEGSHTSGDGTLEIEHPQEGEEVAPPIPAAESTLEAQGQPTLPGSDFPKITPQRDMLPMAGPPHIRDVHGAPLGENPFAGEYDGFGAQTVQRERSYLIDEPTLPSKTPKGPDAPTEPSRLNPTDVLPVAPPEPLIPHDIPGLGYTPPAMPPVVPPAPASPAWQPAAPPLSGLPPSGTTYPPEHRQTLREIEESVRSPHVTSLSSGIDEARTQVLEALKRGPQPLEPLAALNANPLGQELHPKEEPKEEETPPAAPNIMVDDDGNIRQAATPPQRATPPPPPQQPAPLTDLPQTEPLDMPLPSVRPGGGQTPPVPSVPPPPPGPPPITPPNFPGQGYHQ